MKREAGSLQGIRSQAKVAQMLSDVVVRGSGGLFKVDPPVKTADRPIVVPLSLLSGCA